MVSGEKTRNKQQASDSQSPPILSFPLPSTIFHSPAFSNSYIIMSSPSIHTSSVSDLLCLPLRPFLLNSSPLSLLVSGKLITLLTLLDFLWTVHLALFLGVATATNSLLIYLMTVGRKTILSAAHWRGWGKHHAKKHNMRRYHIAGKVTVKSNKLCSSNTMKN